MRFRFFGILVVGLFSIGFISSAKAQPAGFPTPAANASQLFYLQRTPNTNTIVYELNYSNGKLDTDQPVHVYWIRYQEKGQKQELSYIQRKFAYGIKSNKISDKEFELNFVSYSKKKMYLKAGTDGSFHVFTTINKKQSMLTKIYLEIKKGGSFWSPNIDYVEITGIDPDTKKMVQERIKI